MSSDNTDNATSSPESAAGPSPSTSPDGPQTAPSGPDPVPVSRFRSQEQEKALPTNDTCGPLFNRCSPSAALQSALESRLQANLGVNGSPEFELIWKDWDMPAGPPICRLAASGRRTSAKDCSGWPTPMAGTPAQKGYNAAGNTDSSRKTGELLKAWPTPMASDKNDRQKSENWSGNDLPSMSKQAAWATPNTMDHLQTVRSPEELKANSRGCATSGNLREQVVHCAGWPTPMAAEKYEQLEKWERRRDKKKKEGINLQLPLAVAIQQVVDSGKGRSPSSAGTEKPAASLLNPRFSLWLQGYPGAWASSGERAMRSSRK